MDKVAYIVAFNSRDHHSMLYRKVDSLDKLIKIIDSLWNKDEEFIVVSLRIYKIGGIDERDLGML